VYIRDPRWAASGEADVAAAGFTVQLPGSTAEAWRRAQAEAEAGNIHGPAIWGLVQAVSALVGHSLDPATWGEEDLREFTRWVGLVDADAWSGTDQQELESLLRGGGSA
jgi:hypothetical protein